MEWVVGAIVVAVLLSLKGEGGPSLWQATPLKLTGVKPERAVLVPKGLVDSKAAFERCWSTVVTGHDLLLDVWSFAAQNNIQFKRWDRPLYMPQTTGSQHEPDQMADEPRTYEVTGLVKIEKDFLGGTRYSVEKTERAEAIEAYGFGQTSWMSGYANQIEDATKLINLEGESLRIYEQLSDPQAIPSVHGYDFGLSIFPPAIPKPGELRAWSAVHHCWRYGGPQANRLANRGLFYPIAAPGIVALWNSKGGKDLFANSVTTPHAVIGAGGRPYPFSNPERLADDMWINYLTMCCQLAAHGFLSQPSGDMTIPRITQGDTGGGGLFDALGSVAKGVGQTVMRYPTVVAGAALGSPTLFGKGALQAGVQTLQWMGSQAMSTGDRVPWMEDWAPVLVDRYVVGSLAPDPRRYHTLGENPAKQELET